MTNPPPPHIQSLHDLVKEWQPFLIDVVDVRPGIPLACFMVIHRISRMLEQCPQLKDGRVLWCEAMAYAWDPAEAFREWHWLNAGVVKRFPALMPDLRNHVLGEDWPTVSATDKVSIANAVLQHFAPDTTVARRADGRVAVTWSRPYGSETKVWVTRGQDFYPVWNHKWGHGGTAATALAQLVRWIRGQNVLPLQSWRYWASDTIQLFQSGNATDVFGLLVSGGYPEIGKCVLCQRPLEGGHDWWSVKKLSGPCCSYRTGCRQDPQTV